MIKFMHPYKNSTMHVQPPVQSVTRKLGKICAGLIYSVFDFQVTKERLQLERHLQIANDSLQRNNGVDLQKYITLEQSNQVSFCEFVVRFCMEKLKFSNFSCMILNPNIFYILNSNCSNLLYMRNLQEQA